MDLIQYLNEQIKFSITTFGPGQRTFGICDHIKKELLEVLESPQEVEEWVDIAILALDGAWRTGASPEDISRAFWRKLEKNKTRSWPNWRIVGQEKAIEHLRGTSEEL